MWWKSLELSRSNLEGTKSKWRHTRDPSSPTPLQDTLHCSGRNRKYMSENTDLCECDHGIIWWFGWYRISWANQAPFNHSEAAFPFSLLNLMLPWPKSYPVHLRQAPLHSYSLCIVNPGQSSGKWISWVLRGLGESPDDSVWPIPTISKTAQRNSQWLLVMSASWLNTSRQVQQVNSTCKPLRLIFVPRKKGKVRVSTRRLQLFPSLCFIHTYNNSSYASAFGDLHWKKSESSFGHIFSSVFNPLM